MYEALGPLSAPRPGALWSRRQPEPPAVPDETKIPVLWLYHSGQGLLVTGFPGPTGNPMAFPLFALRQAGWLVSDVGMRLLPRSDTIQAFRPGDVDAAAQMALERSRGMKRLVG